jgi:hypothetical protein
VDEEETHLSAIPVIKDGKAGGLGAYADDDGNVVIAEEWTTVRCRICGKVGATPKSEDAQPDPDTGEYAAICGQCVFGETVKYFEVQHLE